MILVTGATGQLGRRIVDQLVARRNRRREDAVRIEAAALRPLPARRATDFTSDT